jgi:protein-L-isoaspartate(D-aspartate) O-methyltransferase
MPRRAPHDARGWSRTPPGGVTEHFVEQARAAGVRDPRVLDALEAVDRRAFVPDADDPRVADDAPVRLPLGQTTSQPSLVALMLEALALHGDERVLEIGTGYGYEAALLAHLAAEVVTVEVVPELAAQAARRLAALAHVHVVEGDGRLGCPDRAPYDAVVIAARALEVPAAVAAQLRSGGRLVVPLGEAGTERCVVLQRHDDGRLEEVASLGRVRFVPLVGDDDA